MFLCLYYWHLQCGWFVLVGVVATLELIYVVIKFFDNVGRIRIKLQEESEIKCKDWIMSSTQLKRIHLWLNLLDKVTLIQTRTSQANNPCKDWFRWNLYANGDGLSYVGVHRRMEWKWKNILHIINNRDTRAVNLDTLWPIFFGGFQTSHGQEIDAKHPLTSLESSA